MNRLLLLGAVLVTWSVIGGCAADRDRRAPIGSISARTGDEILVAGRLVHTGAPVILWFDPGGYDAYRVSRHFAAPEKAGWEQIRDEIPSPNRYGDRPGRPDGGWTLKSLGHVVDQFVIHYDACGTSRRCFRVLQDIRGLSVHFLLDIDGTIYQTLDVKERAWHATTSNDRAVGIEIANIGAYPTEQAATLDAWYSRANGRTQLTFPEWFDDTAVRTPGIVGGPIRPDPVFGRIHDTDLVMYDLTPQQYTSLIRLTAALCAVLPNLRCDYPHEPDGAPLTRRLTDEELAGYSGLLAHWHIQDNKVDPGPAFQWDLVADGASRILAHRGREPIRQINRR